MGKTSEFMRSVFSRSHFTKTVVTQKRKWGVSVRSYLCGENEHDSSIVTTLEETNLSGSCRSNVANISSTIECGEFDSSSVISSEATVTQPLQHSTDRHNKELKRKEDRNSTYNLFRQEDAALIIQSAFKNFLAKRRATAQDEEKRSRTAMASPSKESIGTSIEVQTGNSNSSHVFSIDEENFEAHSSSMRLKTRAQVLKFQEDWDASTVSSVISKMRIQNKLEAATRRERALAYAFSQQLRICAKKKQAMDNGGETMNTWLERWMATREPDTVVRKRMLDTSMEEKESCGSNEVSSLFEGNNVLHVANNIPRPPKYRSKTTRSHPNKMCPKKSKDVIRTYRFEDEKDKRKRPKQT